MKTTEQRIAELKHVMEIEETNNFPNGDLWNDMSDKVYCLEKYGQETMPEIEGEGMSIYNQLD